MSDVIVWSGWVGGVAVGLYALAQLVLTGKVLGVSTGYGNVCALVSNRAYFRKGPYADRMSWRLLFLVGLPLGGLIAGLTSTGSVDATMSLGALYDSVMPAAVPTRGMVLGLGGVMMGFGARAAGGCTSGHAIAGLSLFSAPSLLAAVGFFAGGIAMAHLLFGVMS